MPEECSVESASSLYWYVRGLQLENKFPRDEGTFPISCLRVGKSWGVLNESLWPRKSGEWPPVEPEGLDCQAKKKRISCFQRIRDFKEYKFSIARGRPIVSLYVTDQWNDAKNGVIPVTDPNLHIDAHAVLLVGYNDHHKWFIFANSWGKEWGDKGFGYITYEEFEYLHIESWVINSLFHHPLDRDVLSGYNRARSFYEAILGFSIEYSKEEFQWFEYHIQGVTLAITNSVSGQQAGSRGAVLALEVENLDQAVAELKGKSVPIVTPPFSTPVCRIAEIADPDGNRICLHQLTDI